MDGPWVPEESQAAMLETYKNVLRWSEMIRDRPRLAKHLSRPMPIYWTASSEWQRVVRVN